MMTIDALIEMLEDAKANGIPGGTEVRFATQPNWPMQHHIATEIMGEDPMNEVVYLADGGQVHETPYLPGGVSEQLGWR